MTDLIATGDLGWIGRELLKELLKRGDIDVPDEKLIDCGNSLFFAGSGCACGRQRLRLCGRSQLWLDHAPHRKRRAAARTDRGLGRDAQPYQHAAGTEHPLHFLRGLY